MGLLDDLQASLNRGTAAASRTTKITQLKSQVNALHKQRQQLAAQLGAVLYEKYREDETAREAAEALFEGIASLDAQREEIMNQIDLLQAQAQAIQAAAVVYACPSCGARVPATDLFCSGCGKPIDEIRDDTSVSAVAAAGGNTCKSCGASMSKDDAFCMSCGAKVDEIDGTDDVDDMSNAVDPSGADDASNAVDPSDADEELASSSEADASSTTSKIEESEIGPDVLHQESTEETEPGDLLTCPDCQAEIDTSDIFCGTCGCSLQCR